ncbi:HAD family hydrolase [Kitasatospora viridis]
MFTTNCHGWDMDFEPGSRPPRGAVFFDVDGTLVPGTSSGAHLAGLLGHTEALTRAEAAYSAGELTNHQVCDMDALGWRGRSEAEVRERLASLPLVDGIAETTAWCRRNGLLPVLATLAWQSVGVHLADRFGFQAWCGPELETVGGRYTGRVVRYFDEYGKRDFALGHAATAGLSAARCAAVGDSRSDLPLFREVGLALAFNADPAAEAAADHAVTGSDLRAVLPLLAAWLATDGR